MTISNPEWQALLFTLPYLLNWISAYVRKRGNFSKKTESPHFDRGNVYFNMLKENTDKPRICTIVNWLCNSVVHSIPCDSVNQKLHIAHFGESTNRLPLNFAMFLILGASQMFKSNTHLSHSSHALLAGIKMTTTQIFWKS